MKRSPALRMLSHDHHQSLVAAQSLVRGDESAGVTALRWWRHDGLAHFQIEEHVLLPAWQRACSDADMGIVTRVLAEHAIIRASFNELESVGLGSTDLADLGLTLQRHVRFEERVLFPAIEESLNPVELDHLAERIRAAESAGREA
jgi:hemerythrin-like domain-containing protein